MAAHLRRRRPLLTPTIREYRAGDENGLQVLFEETFGYRKHSTWEWRFQRAPAGPAVIVVADDNGIIVGHSARVSFHASVANRPVIIALGCDAMVAKTHRGTGVYKAIADEIEHRGTWDVLIDFPNDDQVARKVRAGRGVYGRTLDQWIHVCRVTGVGWAPGAMIGGIARQRRRREVVEPLCDLGAELDELADRSAAFVPCIRRRDAAYLRWRWIERPESQWSLFGVRGEGGWLTGWLVVGPRPRYPSGVAAVADLLADDEATTVALLTFAGQWAQRAGFPWVTFEYTDPRAWSRRACYRAGFLPRGRGPNVGLEAVSGWARSVPGVTDLRSWYLTYGDADLD